LDCGEYCEAAGTNIAPVGVVTKTIDFHLLEKNSVKCIAAKGVIGADKEGLKPVCQPY
jgi:hypothetical protein